jgi:type II secretory pathway predicted ATPase ExeA
MKTPNSTSELALYGLKWNPFLPEVPTEALLVDKATESFLWRVERLVKTGGFALITGDPGSGKSVVMRLLDERLDALRDVTVGVVTRAQSALGDFYRELGELFGVTLTVSNRWGGFKALRERWRTHIESTVTRPVLLIDEAQNAAPAILEELRVLSSTEFDSASLLTLVLAGDLRLLERLRRPDLLPLASRIRVRLPIEPASREELVALLTHAIAKAGAPELMTCELIELLSDHAAGNRRSLMLMAAELLEHGAEVDARQLDERLFFAVFDPTKARKGTKRTSEANSTKRKELRA